MIILEEPYVSDFLKETVIEKSFKVLDNDAIRKMDLSDNFNLLNEDDVSSNLNKSFMPLIYSNSENSINWISKNLSETGLPEKINIFKDKVKFRKLISQIYPEFFFKEIDYQDIGDFDISNLKMPFIIKPSIGFLSMGVYPVNNYSEWQKVLSSLNDDMEKFKNLFPKEVMDSSKFIIEEMIEGDEFAVDVYFNQNGEPVILNIFQHPFLDNKDVSDRVYITSKDIIRKYLNKFDSVLKQIGKLADLKNFPMHIELRADENDVIIPIEVNPMRFAGWCTTDLAYFAYGINVYDCYLNQKKPDWENILHSDDEHIYYFAMAEVPASYSKENIQSFDYQAFLNNIKEPMDVRKIDWSKHPLFAIVFAKTKDFKEIENVLSLDIHQYIQSREKFRRI